MNRREFAISITALVAALQARLPISAGATTPAATLVADDVLVLPVAGLVSAEAKLFPKYVTGKTKPGWEREELHLRYEGGVTGLEQLGFNKVVRLDLSPADLPYVVTGCVTEWRRNYERNWLILQVSSVEPAEAMA